MCRLLAVKASVAFETGPHLRAFSKVAARSKEYQGDGWGCALLKAGGGWTIHKSLQPIWEDELEQHGKTTLLLAHARSAFRETGITIENNMPFHSPRDVFVFNGELHGVRLRVPGRIGAEKVFNLIRRFDRGDLEAALRRTVAVVSKRARHIRAMNILLSDQRKVYACSLFNDDPEYFTMSARSIAGGFIIGSEPYAGEPGWSAIENHTVGVLE
jgi:glutamine amidotransferase